MEKSGAERPLNLDAVASLPARMPASPAYVDILIALTHAIQESGGADAVLTGSLANGSGDSYSDIDLEVDCDSESVRARLEKVSAECLRRQGRLIAMFPATHLQMPHLMIHFLEYRHALVKVDLNFVLHSPAQAKPGLRLVGRPEETVFGAAPLSAPAPDPMDRTRMADLYNKFCGWMWYTHTKIARGEYWEADDALAVMRAQALLPFMQMLSGTPYEGFRRIETRFAPDMQARLLATRPASLDAAELRRALLAACLWFDQVTATLAQRVGEGWRTADLQQMRQFVSQAADGRRD